MKENIIQRKLFSDNFIVALIEELSCIGAGFIDGLIISIFLGSTAIAAEGLVYPLFSLVGIVSGAMLLGTKKICVSLMCKNEGSRAESVYSTSVLFAFVVALLIAVSSIVFSGPIVRFLGASDVSSSLFLDAKAYLIGLAFGVPALMLVPIVTPIMQISGRTLATKISLTAIAVLDIIFDIISAVCGFGMLGMGISTSLAQLFGLIILVFPVGKKPLLKFKLSVIDFSCLGSVIASGTPKIIRRLSNLIRHVAMNKLVLVFASSYAMSAISVRNNLSNFTECVGTAIGATVLLLSVVFVSEQNSTSLKGLKERAFRYLLVAVVPLSALIAIFARVIARIYISDNVEILSYTTSAIRFMAIDLVLMAIMMVLEGYWQGIGYTKEVDVIIFLQKLVYPIVCLIGCYFAFGMVGIWASFPIATLLSIITLCLFSLVELKRVSLFPIPAECNIPGSKKIEHVVYSLDQVTPKSEEIQKQCVECGVDESLAMFIALSFEEIAAIVFKQGLGKKKSVEFFAIINDDKVILRFRNKCKWRDSHYCDMFTYDYKHPEHHVGTRIIMNKAKSIDYVGLFGMFSYTIEF